MQSNKRAADVIRALMVVTKTGNRLFSDQTTFGRSIKVTGWPDYAYETAVRVLERHGYNAQIVRVRRRKFAVERQTIRLHVREKAVSYTADGL
jgi:hypothetical protein